MLTAHCHGTSTFRQRDEAALRHRDIENSENPDYEEEVCD